MKRFLFPIQSRRAARGVIRTALCLLGLFAIGANVLSQDLIGVWTDDDTGNRARIDQQGNQFFVAVLGTDNVRTAQGIVNDDHIEMFWTTESGQRLSQSGKYTVSALEWENGTVWRRPIVRVVKNQAGVAQAVSIHVRGAGYLLIPDTANPLVWYYAPDSVRLLEKTIGNDVWPEFSVLNFQRRKTAEELRTSPEPPLVEGATLYFALPIKIDDHTIIDELRARLLEASPVLTAFTSYMPWLREDGRFLSDHEWSEIVKWEGPSGTRTAREFPVLPPELFHNGRRGGAFVHEPVFNIIPSGTRRTLYRKYRSYGTNALLELQELKVLPRLQLRPLPVLRTTVHFGSLTSNDEVSSSQALRKPQQDYGDPQRDSKYSKVPFFTTLGKNGARIVDDIVTNKATGLKARGTLEYHLPETYRLAVLPTDPGRILCEWLIDLSHQDVRTETEHEIVKILYAERQRAYKLGYVPDHHSERWNWARLLREGDFQIVKDDLQDHVHQNHLRTLRLAAFYLVKIYHTPFKRLRHHYLIDGEGKPQEIGNEVYREWIGDMLALRREEGPNFLNFMTHPIYRGRSIYDTKKRKAAKQWVLFDSAEMDGTPWRNAVMLFEKQVFKSPKTVVEFAGGGSTQTTTWNELDAQYRIPWANQKMEAEFRTVRLDAGFINISQYSDEVLGRLLAFEKAPIQPGAVYLPDPADEQHLGLTEVVVTPSIRFKKDADPRFAEQLLDAVQSVEEPIQVEGHHDNSLISLRFPAVKWDQKNGWGELEIPVLRFSLTGIDPDFAAKLKSDAKFLAATYVLDFQIRHPRGDVKFQELLPVFEGTQSLPYLSERLEKIPDGSSFRLDVINR